MFQDPRWPTQQSPPGVGPRPVAGSRLVGSGCVVFFFFKAWISIVWWCLILNWTSMRSISFQFIPIHSIWSSFWNSCSSMFTPLPWFHIMSLPGRPRVVLPAVPAVPAANSPTTLWPPFLALIHSNSRLALGELPGLIDLSQSFLFSGLLNRFNHIIQVYNERYIYRVEIGLTIWSYSIDPWPLPGFLQFVRAFF